MNAITTIAILLAGLVSLQLTADHLLRRRIARHMKSHWSGSLITDRYVDVDVTHLAKMNRLNALAGGITVRGNVVTQTQRQTTEKLITPKVWWKCVLPWPGKKVWVETLYTKVALLGAVLEYQAVSAWDWDEAWVIEIDSENIIASSNKAATALAYLQHRGVL